MAVERALREVNSCYSDSRLREQAMPLRAGQSSCARAPVRQAVGDLAGAPARLGSEWELLRRESQQPRFRAAQACCSGARPFRAASGDSCCWAGFSEDDAWSLAYSNKGYFGPQASVRDESRCVRKPWEGGTRLAPHISAPSGSNCTCPGRVVAHLHTPPQLTAVFWLGFLRRDTK